MLLVLRVKSIVGGIVHRCAKSERIRVEHRIVRVDVKVSTWRSRMARSYKLTLWLHGLLRMLQTLWPLIVFALLLCW